MMNRVFLSNWWKAGLLAVLLIATGGSVSAQEPDTAGSKDHPAFSRMAGYYINNYEHQDFSVFEFSLDPIKSVEGEYWSIQYVINEGARKPGPLQIGRNYTNLVKQRGGTLLLEQLDASGGTTVARLPVKGGGNLWLEVRVSNGGEVYNLEIVQESAMAQQVTFTADSLAEALNTSGTVAVRSILFDTGKATIQQQSNEVLGVIIQLLQSHPDLKLEVRGHTDNVGAPAANLALSRDRAAAVKTYLVTTGSIDAGRLTTAGFGDTQPVADNATDEGRSQNRRVELVKK